MDLWTWCIRTSRNDVGLSPVSVVGPCEQARPPYTPRVDGADRSVGHRDCPDRRAAWCFSTTRSLAHHARPDCDPSRSVLAWPLRQRPLPGAAGCVPFPEGKFEQGFLDGHGPAQVGLSPPFAQRLTAPFATQSTTPAVHTGRDDRPAGAGNAPGAGEPGGHAERHYGGRGLEFLDGVAVRGRQELMHQTDPEQHSGVICPRRLPLRRYSAWPVPGMP